VSDSEERGVCANCGREVPATEIDPEGWCGTCRREVVRRATIIAHLLGGLAAVAGGTWIVMGVQPGPRFVLVWIVLLGVVYFFLFKLGRRVAFEAIRARGVRPSREE
jgi:hypothetical protein